MTLSNALDPDLVAIAALTGTGWLTRTAANTWAQRTLQAGTFISISNPAGIAGDPVLAFSDDAAAAMQIAKFNLGA